jgi:uncharacterized membrane protein YgdD (TMEM256/DUF423 family)
MATSANSRWLLMLGAVNGALVVILGAYSAHALTDSTLAALFQTALQYHMFNTLGLLAIGIIAASQTRALLLSWAGGLMLVGIVLFCGGLYLTVITGHRFSVLAPYGGTALILAWTLFAVALIRLR